MPKLKSHSGAAKRFTTTGTGKIRNKKANLRHMLTAKSAKNKRNARKTEYIANADVKRVTALIPYA